MELVGSCAVEIDIVISRVIMYALGQIVFFCTERIDFQWLLLVGVCVLGEGGSVLRTYFVLTIPVVAKGGRGGGLGCRGPAW